MEDEMEKQTMQTSHLKSQEVRQSKAVPVQLSLQTVSHRMIVWMTS